MHTYIALLPTVAQKKKVILIKYFATLLISSAGVVSLSSEINKIINCGPKNYCERLLKDLEGYSLRLSLSTPQ